MTSGASSETLNPTVADLAFSLDWTACVAGLLQILRMIFNEILREGRACDEKQLMRVCLHFV